MNTGGYMKDFRVESDTIDSVIDYIGDDVKRQEDPKIAEHLVELHSFLLSHKSEMIRKNIKEDNSSDMLMTYSIIVKQSMEVVFGNWESHTLIEDNSISIYNDLVYINIVINEGRIECYAAFYKFLEPHIAADVAITLRDIFRSDFYVSNEPFIVDQSTNTYVWGEEEITNYQKKTRGIKINPIIYFDENGEVGNC